MLTIAFCDGEFGGDLEAFARICEVEGSVVPDGRPPYAPLEEALRLLEMSAEKYCVPRPTGECFTVLIGRKAGAKVEPLARLDVYAQNGRAIASLLSEDGSRMDCEPVVYSPDEDVVTIMRNLLDEQCDERELSTLVKARLKSVRRAKKVNPDDLDDL